MSSSAATDSTGDDYFTDHTPGMSASHVAFDAVAVAIFVVVSFTFLFPCNRIIPLDRRSVAVMGATLCYITRYFKLIILYPKMTI